MNFTKKTWRQGDTLTHTDLNRIESGIYELVSIVELLSGSSNVLIQKGKTIIKNDTTIRNGGKTSLNLNFPTSFKSGTLPIVVVTPTTAVPGKTFAAATDISPNGARIVVETVVESGETINRDTLGINWIAIGENSVSD